MSARDSLLAFLDLPELAWIIVATVLLVIALAFGWVLLCVYLSDDYA